jgi:hypothetical protein
MEAGQVLLGILLLLFAGWLQQNENNGWPDEDAPNDENRAYYNKRRQSRTRTNCLIALCGLLAGSAGMIPSRRWFIAAWTSISLILFVIILMAGLDALRTHRFHQQRLRQLRKEFRQASENESSDNQQS